MIITTITRIPCYIIRKYATLAQVHQVHQKTGESFKKVKELPGSLHYKANNHPNLSTPDGRNTTGTHSDIIKENGVTILSDFLSVTDLKGVNHKQNEILRSQGLRCVDFTEQELESYDYGEVLRWAFLAHFRKNHPIEYCQLQTTLKSIPKDNPSFTPDQISREIQFETDRALMKEYHDAGFYLPKNSPYWNQIYG